MAVRRRTTKQVIGRGLVMLGTALCLFAGARAEAATIQLTPDDTTCTTNVNSQLSGTQVLDIVDDCFGAAGPLSLLYKAEVGGSDYGTFASSYDTTFANTTLDPEEATILYLGGTYMDCSACYLVVKDGNQKPAQYFYDLSTIWNGTDTIALKEFWPEQGAISNISIWGRATSVPEPTSLLLFATGLGWLTLKRRLA